MSEQSTIDVKFELMLEKMDNLNEKYLRHAEQDVEHFGKINANLTKLVDRFDNMLLDSDKGIVLKVDRLVQSEKKRSWLVKTAVGGTITSFLAHIWQLVKS